MFLEKMQSSALFAKQYSQRTNDNFKQTKCVSMRKRGIVIIHTVVKFHIHSYVMTKKRFLAIYFILLRKLAQYLWRVSNDDANLQLQN